MSGNTLTNIQNFRMSRRSTNFLMKLSGKAIANSASISGRRCLLRWKSRPRLEELAMANFIQMSPKALGRIQALNR